MSDSMSEQRRRRTLNDLASLLHRADGWTAPQGYDYSAAPAARERRYYLMAELAYEFFFEHEEDEEDEEGEDDKDPAYQGGEERMAQPAKTPKKYEVSADTLLEALSQLAGIFAANDDGVDSYDAEFGTKHGDVRVRLSRRKARRRRAEAPNAPR